MSGVKDSIQSVNGFKVAGVSCGIKPNDQLDFALIVSDEPCMTAGIFTTSQVKAAPVLVDMQRLRENPERIRAVVINSGNANACTGQQGIENTRQTACWVAEAIDCSEDEVLVLSTGVIGVQLPMDKIRKGIDLAIENLGDDWEATARAIMTTDTQPKLACLDNGNNQVAGIGKGSGMIAPNMATMLGVLVTDTKIDTPEEAKNLLLASADLSFNRIVVDGDTSTNDTVLLLANGKSGQSAEALSQAVTDVSIKLATDIVRDGEGATKLITIHVNGALTDADAHQIANTIAISPLVKTAFYGNDANWGRILMAVGRAGVPLQQECLKLTIAPTGKEDTVFLDLVVNGEPTIYSEEVATEIVSEKDITIIVDCGLQVGGGSSTVWTCDMSHDYISINADYRT